MKDIVSGVSPGSAPVLHSSVPDAVMRRHGNLSRPSADRPSCSGLLNMWSEWIKSSNWSAVRWGINKTARFPSTKRPREDPAQSRETPLRSRSLLFLIFFRNTGCIRHLIDSSFDPMTWRQWCGLAFRRTNQHPPYKKNPEHKQINRTSTCTSAGGDILNLKYWTKIYNNAVMCFFLSTCVVI